MITIERFKTYLNTKDITNSRAEKDCGLSNGLIGNALKTRSTIGSDKLEKILTAYPDLSAEWLLRGTGSMIIGDGIAPEQIFKKLGMPANSDKIIEVWMKFMSITEGMQELYKKSI